MTVEAQGTERRFPESVKAELLGQAYEPPAEEDVSESTPELTPELYAELKRQGVSDREIGRRFGIPYGSLSSWKRQHNLSARDIRRDVPYPGPESGAPEQPAGLAAPPPRPFAAHFAGTVSPGEAERLLQGVAAVAGGLEGRRLYICVSVEEVST